MKNKHFVLKESKKELVKFQYVEFYIEKPILKRIILQTVKQQLNFLIRWLSDVGSVGETISLVSEWLFFKRFFGAANIIIHTSGVEQ